MRYMQYGFPVWLSESTVDLPFFSEATTDAGLTLAVMAGLSWFWPAVFGVQTLQKAKTGKVIQKMLNPWSPYDAWSVCEDCDDKKY